MSRKILVAQNIKELEYIIKNTKGEFSVLPLNLKTQLYCLSNNLIFFDLIKLSGNELHKYIIHNTENILKKLDYNFFKYDSLKKELKAWIRFRLYSYIFLEQLIKKLDKKYNIKEIIVSGWDSQNELYIGENYFVSNLLLSIFKKKTKIINKNIIKSKNLTSYRYKVNLINQKDRNINYILLSNIGYNFKRIIIWAIKKKQNILLYSFKNESILKKVFFKFFSINLLEIKKIKDLKNNLKIKFSNLIYKKKRIDKVILHNINNLNTIFSNLLNKAKCLEEVIKNKNIKISISNITRGEDGLILDISKKKNIKTLCIPHGTLSKYFNKYDKIYKKNISESIINENSSFIASQSKITDSFFKKNKIRSKIIKTGNLIFNSTNNKGKNILYAVTNKDFYNMQFFGVETYYEYLDNLKFLNSIASELKVKIFVKPHPTEFDSIKYLKKTYSKLIFTKKNNKILFKKIALTISFSSTMIEDSLSSKIPVVLLDRWKRYKHCLSETNPKKKSTIYYITNKQDLLICIDRILKNKKSCDVNKNFSPYKNFSNLFNQMSYEK